MKRLRRLVIGLVMVVVAVNLLPILLAPAAPGHGPYVSALASLSVVSEAAAQTTCNNKQCVIGGGGRARCKNQSNRNCVSPSPGLCRTSFC